MAINSTTKNAFYYSIGEVVPRVIGFILLPLYTRYLSTSDFGIISYTNTFILFLYTIGTLSLNSYAIRFFFLKDEEGRKDMLGTVAITITFVNLLIVCLGYMFLPHIIDKYEIQVPWKPYFQLALLTNFMDSFAIIPFVIYRVQGAAKKFVTLGISRTICMASVTIFMVCYRNGGLPAYYWSQIIVHTPFTIIYIAILSKYVNFKFKIAYLKEGLKFALPLIPASIAYILLNASDRIILERNVLISDLGVYNMAVTLSLALNVVVQGISRAFEPVLYSRHENSDYYGLLRRVKSMYFLIVVSGAMFISFFSEEVFVLFTSEKFHKGYIFVPLLVSMVCFHALNSLYGVILSGDKKTGLQATSTIVGGIVSVCFNLALIPIFGIFVAAGTQVFSMFVMAFIKERSIKIDGLNMWKEILVLVVMISLSYFLYMVLSQISIIGVVLKFVIWVIAMFLIMRVYRFHISDITSMLGIRKNK